jgi:hypothetical protein
MLIYINLSFDFLGLDKVYFKNYFANELIRRWVVFKAIQNTRCRVLSDIKRSAAPRVLYLIKHSYSCFK